MKTIIYVGAYDGRKASIYLKDDLYAIEACPTNYKECKKRLVGAKVYNIAIGAKDGVAEFNVWNRTKPFIAQNLNKIKHWEIRKDDYRNIENEDATWFIDPPYQHG